MRGSPPDWIVRSGESSMGGADCAGGVGGVFVAVMGVTMVTQITGQDE
jgi:hypothetical protein